MKRIIIGITGATGTIFGWRSDGAASERKVRHGNPSGDEPVGEADAQDGTRRGPRTDLMSWPTRSMRRATSARPSRRGRFSAKA